MNELVVSIDGKIKDRVQILPGQTKEAYETIARDAVKDLLEGKNAKALVVGEKLVNFVILNETLKGE